MKELVVISGKGGTGKTSLTAAFSYLAGKLAVTADCDVDAADMHLLTGPTVLQAEEFYSGQKAVLDPDFCTFCGKCHEVCRFDGVTFIDGSYGISDLNCEGCGYCSHVCPTGTISMEARMVGHWYRSETRYGTTLIHAHLEIGAENSGKLVTQVKEEAAKTAREIGADYVIVDGSPGIGCPVVASLSGAKLVLLVTEPTVSGFHDLKRVHELIRKFRIPAVCIINKGDLNTGIRSEIINYLKKENVELIGTIPYDEDFSRAITEGKNLLEIDSPVLSPLISKSWDRVRSILDEK